MTELSLARDLVLVILVALGGGFVAKRLKLPLLVGYILGGVLVGTFLGSWLRLGPEISTLAEIGVALLLFTVGIEFSFARLKKVWNVAVWGGVFQIILTILLGLLIFPLFGLDFYSSLFLGSAFSLSSTAIIVRILTEKGEADSLPGEIMIGWLLVQDLAVLPMMTILPQIAKLDGAGWFSIFGAIAKAALLLTLVIILGKTTFSRILDRIAKTQSRELLLLSVVSLCLVAAFTTTALGFPFALGAFFAGLLVAETSQNHAVFAEVRPLRDIFSVVFFVSLGFLVNPTVFLPIGVKILTLGLTVILLKFILVAALIFYFGYHAKTSIWVAGGLVGVGEFAFVLAQMGHNSGFINSQVYSLTLAIALLTMLLVPLIFNLTPHLYLFLKDFTDHYFPRFYGAFFAQYDRHRTGQDLPIENHVVICGHGRVGKPIRKALELANIPYVVVDFNHSVVKELSRYGVNVVYGDPADLEVLDFAQVDRARAVIIALPDRHSQRMIIQNSLRLNPRAVIICRSHFDEDKEHLKASGAHVIIQPEFEASLAIISEILKVFSKSQEAIAANLRQIKRENGI